MSFLKRGLNRNPFDYIPCDFFAAAIVEAGGSWISVAGEDLNVFEGDALAQQIGDRSDAERVRTESRGQTSSF